MDSNLEKVITKNDVIAHKNEALKKLNNLLKYFLKQTDVTDTTANNFDLKKVDLLSTWIRTYSRFLKQELTFDSSKMKTYKRGEVIQVDLGFRIGHEEGGVHYAVVLNKSDSPFSDILTVVPLSSKKETTKPNRYTVDLGNELYEKLNEKYLKKFHESIKNIDISPNPVLAGEEFTISVEIDTTEADKIQHEINMMKEGSIALISQLTTVSKIRIIKPLYNSSPFSGIRLGKENLDLIDERIRKLYIGK